MTVQEFTERKRLTDSTVCSIRRHVCILNKIEFESVVYTKLIQKPILMSENQQS